MHRSAHHYSRDSSRRSNPSHVAVSSASMGRSQVDDIVSRYVLNSTLPSERAHRVQRSNTPPARTTNAVLNASGLVYSPTTQRYTDIRRSENQLSELRNKMEHASRNADEVALTVKDLERSKTLLSELETENVKLRTKVRSLSILVEEKERSIRDVESSLRTARQHLAETEELRVQDMTTLRQQINILQQENADLAARCDGLRSSITSRGGEHSMSRDELRKRLEQLEIQLETSRSTNFRLSHQLEDKEHQLGELHRLQSEIPRLESEAKESMGRLQDAQKMIQQKEDERLQTQEKHLRQLRDLAEQVDAWKRETNRHSDRGFEHHQLQSETASRVAVRDNEVLAEIADKVRSSVDELRNRQVEVERLQLDIQRLKDENRILRETSSGKEFLHNESTMLRSQVRQLEENISLLQQLNSDLKSQLEKKEAAAAAEASTHLNQVEQLRRELASAKSEVSALDALKKENHKLRKETQKTTHGERVNELRAEKTVLEQEVTELREKLIGMTANAIQVERIYAEQLDDLHKEVSQLKLKETECRSNHMNPERENQLRSRTEEIENENELLRQRLEANIKLQEEISGERRKETIKREQQHQLQSQLSSLTFGKSDAPVPSTRLPSPRKQPSPNAQPLSAADVYKQRMQRAGVVPAPLQTTSSTLKPSSPNNTEDIRAPSSPLHRMTSTVDIKSSGNLTQQYLPSVSSLAQKQSTGPITSRTASPPDPGQTQAFPSGLPQPSVPKKLQQTTIRYTDDGVGSIRFGSVSQLFFAAAESGGETVAIKTERRQSRHNAVDGERSGYASSLEWAELTWQTYYIKAAQFAKALISHRCDPNAAVMIISNGSAETSIAFCASILGGCLPTTAFPTSASTNLLRQIEETAAEIIVLDDVDLLQRLLNTTRRMASIKQFVLCDASSVPQSIRGEFGQMVATFEQFSALSAYVTDTMLQTRIEGQSADTPACIGYTPGTTGDPKGVLLSHDNLQFAAAAFAQAMVLTDKDAVSHLSLTSFAEVHGLVVDIILPMITVASKGMPFVTHFVQYHGDSGQLPFLFRSIRPTFLFAAPGIYDDVLLNLQAAEREIKTDSDAKLHHWAKTVAREASFQRQRDIIARVPSGPIKGAHLAASMNDKVKASLGLDCVVQTICAGGPVPMPILEGFASAGFDLLQIFTAAETTGLATASAEACFQFGTCGFALPSTDIRIDASVKGNERNGYREGELMVRGRNVMIGYLTNANGASAPNSDGWWRTGDLARIANDTGLLTIIGRIRDQVVVFPTGSPTNPSDRISPQRIEQEILRICSALSHVVVYGDQRKFLVALMTLRSKKNPQTNTYTDDLCGEALHVNPEVLTVTTARRDDKWLKYIAGVIAQCNSVAESASMKVKRFCILPSDFSVLGGELTSSDKVRRGAVLTKYFALVEKLYADDTATTPRKS